MASKEIIFYRGVSYSINRLCVLLGVSRTRIGQLIDSGMIHRRIDEATLVLEEPDDVEDYEMGE